MRKYHKFNVNHFFIIIYLSLLFYIIIARYILHITTGIPSEETPIEIVTLIIVMITTIIVFTIFLLVKDENENMIITIWFLTFILFFIFLWRELDLYFPVPLQTNILGFFFLLLVTYYIWHIDRFSAKLCIFGIIALVIAQVCDNILDFHIMIELARSLHLSVVEESLELYSSLFFLHAFTILRLNESYKVHKQSNLSIELKKKISSFFNRSTSKIRSRSH